MQPRESLFTSADNGNEILGHARNLDEVYVVFGVFHPRKNSGFPEGHKSL